MGITELDFSFNLVLFFRIIVAAFCGGIIGVERQHHAKAAGFRTHIIIAVAAALMMEISKYGFNDVIDETVKLDPSRIAAGLAGAIGFLGAGIIFVHKNEVMGLTTSAGILATVGIGMAVGGGMYVLGIAVTVLIALLQFVLHRRQERKAVYARETCKVQIHLTEKNMDEIFEQLESSEINVVSIRATRNKTKGSEMEAILTMTYPKSMKFEQLVSIMNSLAHVRSVEIVYRPGY
ncbi:MAG: MgtC/SapB family protein [Lachnospiraceae bacterium]|nr:MgtC/SapB family protein [Lachnospiraceae bacterium]